MAERSAEASPTFAYDVYLGYPAVTRPWKDRIERDLQARGIRCFSDSVLRAGDTWSDVLESGLDRSRVFVILWSADTQGAAGVTSELGAFRALIRQAPESGRRIVAVFLGGRKAVDAAPETLRTTHGILVDQDVYAAGPDQRSAAWDRLLGDIAEAVTPGGGAVPAGQRSPAAGLRRDEDQAMWLRLSDDVRQVLAVAAASESVTVGTRALLFGLWATASGRTPLIRLLEAAGHTADELVNALAELPPPGQFRPVLTAEYPPLQGLPLMTRNARTVLSAALTMAGTTGSKPVTADHLFAALLGAAATTAYAGLLKLTGSVELTRAHEVFLRHLARPADVDLDREFRDAITLPRQAQEPEADDQREDLGPATTLSSDQSTLDDALDHRLYADAIAHFIRDARTRAPLAIGIKARWGAGKTSTMRMVRVALDPDAEKQVPSNLTPARLSIKELLSKTRRVSPDAAAKALEPGQDASKHRTTIWFNAWKYQSSEQTWAGLAHAILTQVD